MSVPYADRAEAVRRIRNHLGRLLAADRDGTILAVGSGLLLRHDDVHVGRGGELELILGFHFVPFQFFFSRHPFSPAVDVSTVRGELVGRSIPKGGNI